MHQRVQQRMAREAASREDPGDNDGQRQAEANGPRRDGQGKPNGFPFFRAQAQVNEP